MRAALIVALAASVAGASVVVSRTWAIRRGDATLVEVRETPSGVALRDWTDKFGERELTKEEAASLGRALLEAVGEKSEDLPDTCQSELRKARTRIQEHALDLMACRWGR